MVKCSSFWVSLCCPLSGFIWYKYVSLSDVQLSWSQAFYLPETEYFHWIRAHPVSPFTHTIYLIQVLQFSLSEWTVRQDCDDLLCMNAGVHEGTSSRTDQSRSLHIQLEKKDQNGFVGEDRDRRSLMFSLGQNWFSCLLVIKFILCCFGGNLCSIWSTPC